MKNILLTTGLMFSVVSTTLPIYEQEREALYALHTLEQDFADVPMVKQNVDMFISVFQMNTQLLEKKLAIANQKAKNSVLFCGAGLVGAALCTVFFDQISSDVVKKQLSRMVLVLGYGFAGVMKGYPVLDTFNAFKERNALKEALALDQEILEQLVTIKELAFFDISTNVAEEPMHELNAEVSEAAELE
jgi:hypothetical protein